LVLQSRCFILNSFRPMPAASYQCTSARCTKPSANRTRAIPCVCASDRAHRLFAIERFHGLRVLWRTSRLPKCRPGSRSASVDAVKAAPYHQCRGGGCGAVRAVQDSRDVALTGLGGKPIVRRNHSVSSSFAARRDGQRSINLRSSA
jgi:hypothetical protein